MKKKFVFLVRVINFLIISFQKIEKKTKKRANLVPFFDLKEKKCGDYKNGRHQRDERLDQLHDEVK